MVAAIIPRYKPKARQPFLQTLSVEFGVTKGHVYRVLSGERESPLKARLVARQRELLRGAAKQQKLGVPATLPAEGAQ